MSPNHLNLFVRWTVPMGTFMLAREMSGWKKREEMRVWRQIEIKKKEWDPTCIQHKPFHSLHMCEPMSMWVCMWSVVCISFNILCDILFGPLEPLFSFTFFPFLVFIPFFFWCACVLLTHSNQGLSNGWSVHCWGDLCSHELGKWRHFVFIWLQHHNML